MPTQSKGGSSSAIHAGWSDVKVEDEYVCCATESLKLKSGKAVAANIETKFRKLAVCRSPFLQLSGQALLHHVFVDKCREQVNTGEALT